MATKIEKLTYLSNLLKGNFESQEWELLIANKKMREDLANVILEALEALKLQTYRTAVAMVALGTGSSEDIKSILKEQGYKDSDLTYFDVDVKKYEDEFNAYCFFHQQ